MLGPEPTFTPPVSVTAVPAGVFTRLGLLVTSIKSDPNYTDAIGRDLGIIAAQTPFDPQCGKPVIKITFSSGGHPTLLWTKGKFQGIEIWKDKG